MRPGPGDDLGDQWAYAAARGHSALERPIPAGQLIVDLVRIHQPGQAHNGACEARRLDQIGHAAVWSEALCDGGSATLAKPAGYLAVDAERKHEDQTLDACRRHGGNHGMRLLVQVFTGQIGIDEILADHGLPEQLSVQHVADHGLGIGGFAACKPPRITQQQGLAQVPVAGQQPDNPLGNLATGAKYQYFS